MITVCGRPAAYPNVTAERLSISEKNATTYAQRARESLVNMAGPRRRQTQLEHWDHLWWAYAFRLLLAQLPTLRGQQQ